jgi:hypothetical protein
MLMISQEKSLKSLEVSPYRIRVAPNILHIIGLLHLTDIEWVWYSLGIADNQNTCTAFAPKNRIIIKVEKKFRG